MSRTRTRTACVMTLLMTLLISKPSQGLPTPPSLNRFAEPLFDCDPCLPIFTTETYTENRMSWTYSSSTTYIPLMRKFPVMVETKESDGNSSSQETEVLSNQTHEIDFAFSDEQDSTESSEEDLYDRRSFVYETQDDSFKTDDFDEDD